MLHFSIVLITSYLMVTYVSLSIVLVSSERLVRRPVLLNVPIFVWQDLSAQTGSFNSGTLSGSRVKCQGHYITYKLSEICIEIF